ncbi:MAG: isopentenyl-diphosphate Delta-isomerase [Candidatus Aenigmarchaeota archaeon]|nr:isopentenyl-diphosphate Delta-isomerase [Candidatus Aenigmarchaeota archaeon]MDI6722461.1 isopentenyl-diphosphate Delta-isomerase [Candidatus Aenigmarchaeota archaeon]
MPELLILVDSKDKEIGYREKEECHKNPVPLHRAFSVFIFNKKGQLLIQKRNKDKKTWGGVWSNTCCSHPRKNEDVLEAAERRLKEELGFATDLRYMFRFEYDAVWNKIWGEHELDHVFVGEYDGKIIPNKDEVEDWKFANIIELKKEMNLHPEKYTPWFRVCLNRVLKDFTTFSSTGA